ncbi:hypothetical protein BCR42DRAFT_410406 [Absidia repens]|uniref:Uncharacterized protein n=1 Tax=Absidia repens TaxID=90262 RepID=A0A1X2INZ6_9FUNG|nr:hypothetical protein BCR42DRAFT_410406 [Absidia repens]
MTNDNAALSFSDDSSNKSPPTPFMLKEELYQELDELLTAFRSDAQRQFCMDQGIIQKDDLEGMQQTVQQLQYSLRANNHPHQHQQLWLSLTRIIQTILQHYGHACQQRNMRLLDEFLTNQYITDWHRLKQQWDTKVKENQHLHLILEDIILLAQSWHQQHHHTNNNNNNSSNSSNGNPKSINKPIVMMASLSTLPQRLSSATKRSSLVSKRKSVPIPSPPSSSSSHLSFSSLSSSTSEDILTSILATFDYPPGAYMVTIDNHNYKQLGLQHSKIGTRQIIFDGHQLSTNDIISMMHHLSDAFSSLFTATAQTHLAAIDTQIKKAQPFYTLNSMKQLLTQIMEESTTLTSNFGYQQNTTEPTDNACCNSHYHRQHQQHQPTPVTTTSSSITPHHRISKTSSPQPLTHSSLAVLTPFRLSSPAPTNQPWDHPIPIPSFAPAPWQLPDLLKPRYPYNPLLFGLLRRKTGIIINNNQQQPPSTSTFVKHAHHSSQNRTVSPPPSHKGKKKSSTIPTTKNIVNTNAPNKHAPHHYHASSSATINDGTDNNNNNYHAPPIRPTPSRTCDITAPSSPLLRHHQRRYDNYICSSTGRAKRYLDPVVMQSREDKFKTADENDDDESSNIDSSISSSSNCSSNGNSNSNSMAVAVAPFTSVSVDKLSFYLGKIAGQFYQDLLTHTRIRYQEAQDTLDALERQMLELYRHLQLASSRAVMHRALMIVQELDNQQHHYYYHYQQQQQQQQQGQCSEFGCGHPQQQSYDDDDSLPFGDSNIQSTTTTDSYSQAGSRSLVNRWTPICIDHSHAKDNNGRASTEPQQPPPATFYHALPPGDGHPANIMTTSETTIQAEHPPPPSKEDLVILPSKSKSLTTSQHMDNPTLTATS